MPLPTATTSPAARSGPKLRFWVEGGAIVAGFLLTGIAGTLPEHLQPKAFPLGIGLMLAGIAASLARSAREAGLQWRGFSPAVGILIGPVAFLCLSGWYHLRSDANQGVSSGTPLSAARAAASSRPPFWSAPASASAPSRRAEANVSPLTPESDEARHERLLGELNGILDEKARPAIQATRSSALLAARRVDPDTLAPRLETAQRGLAELRESVDRLKYDNPSFSVELDSVLGDTTPLADLDSGLRQLSTAAADRDALRGVAESLQGAALRANQWLLGCEKRIQGPRGGAGTP